MEIGKTHRGFELVTFRDCYGVECSLQQSSLAELEQPGASAVWLGVDEPNPQVLASQAASVGVSTGQATGWVPYPISEAVSITTRMHLTRDQVAELIPLLEQWLKTGSFDGSGQDGNQGQEARQDGPERDGTRNWNG